MDKIKELFFILKSDEDGNQFFYDKDLNRDYQFDYEDWSSKVEYDCRYFRCYLFTKDEIELIKKKIGDGYYLELDDINDEYPIDMYVICTIKEEIWVKDVQNYSWNFLNEWYDDSHKYEDVDEILMDLGSNYDEFDAYMQKKCEGSYFDGNLVRRALEKSRIYPEFILAYKKLYANDYKQWWRIRKKYRHRLV